MDQESHAKRACGDATGCEYYGFKKNRLAFRMSIDISHQVRSFNPAVFKKNKSRLGERDFIYGKWDIKRSTLMGMKIISNRNVDDGTEKQTRLLCA